MHLQTWVNSPETSTEDAKTLQTPPQPVQGFPAEQAELRLAALAGGLEAEVGQGMMQGEVGETGSLTQAPWGGRREQGGCDGSPAPGATCACPLNLGQELPLVSRWEQSVPH